MERSYGALFPEAIHIWPGWTPQRRELVDQAQSYLYRAEPLVANNPEALRELAHAWFLVGNVEGNRNSASLKDFPAAEKSYRESERLLEALLEGNPSDGASQQLLREVRAAAESAEPTGSSKTLVH